MDYPDTSKLGLLYVTSVADVKTVEALRVRLGEYLQHCAFVSGNPPTLYALNRRYGAKALQLSTTVREQVMELIREGKAEAFERKRKIIFVDGSFMNGMREHHGSDAEGYEAALEMILGRAQ